MTDPTASPSPVPAPEPGGATVLVADFLQTEAALAAYQALAGLAADGVVEVEGAIVVAKAPDGTLSVVESADGRTGRGAAWGAVGGAVVGVLFPPAILGSAVVAGVIGAALGKGSSLAHRRQRADELAYAIDPGHCGLVALVSDAADPQVGTALATATRVLRTPVQGSAVSTIRDTAQQAVDQSRGQQGQDRSDPEGGGRDR